MEDDPEEQAASTANFAFSPEALKDSRHRLSPRDAAALDDFEAALAKLNLEPTPEEPTAPPPAPVWEALARELVATARAENRKGGKQAQARRMIDVHRSGAGREDYNAKRREEYAAFIEATEHRTPRRNKKATPERRKEQVATAVAKLRASRSPEQIEADRLKDAERKKQSRAAAKKQKEAEDLAAAEAIKAGRIV